MLQTRFIPINAILKDMYFLMNEYNIKEDFILEFAIYGMEQLTTHKLYEMAVCVLPVDNFQASYPEGMLGIQSVMYNKCNIHLPEEFVCTSTTKLEADDESQFISQQIETKITNFRMFRFEKIGWDYLSLSNNTYDRTIMCKDSPNLSNHCNDWFIPDHSKNRFMTSFDEGLIAVAYYRYLVDENGNFLIPDDPMYMEALQSYIFYKLYERLWHLNKEGAQGKYQHYLSKWQQLCATVKASFMMLSLPEHVNLDKQNRFFRDSGATKIYTGQGRERMNLGDYYG